ncbi:alcohol oxidase [Lentinus tigrinus ALCF2SS1-7]|uniref:Alcohol oxidase n=1 Tax=Lentinus tigrinus ALCF2SS1-6 TaxID=1328759 RepID=A0A5C2SFD3_9APHY|nr:alcohol oxidase [Lentinus tigrinus ALCF2SS1-6]RPD77759.1 alcohol oxidase [Lentinus tigrinus ALCF2SS1-7]
MKFRVTCPIVVLGLGGTRCLGALFDGPVEVLNRTYDFIIVGAGAGGGVMASRLSEDPRIRVLLVEAGGSDFLNLNLSVPGFAPSLPGSQFDWNFTTVPQAGLNDRVINYPRGFVLGGSTSINQMAFNRGTKDDYDRWARVTGDDGWSWDKLYPFVKGLDRITPPADHHNTTGEFDPEVHDHGLLPVSLTGFPLPTDDMVIETTAQLPDQFPFNLDCNSGDAVGVSWSQSTILRGHRVSSATSYLAWSFNRSNLDVVVNTHVTKVLPVGFEGNQPVMRGVQLSQSADGLTHTLTATKEVILCAGAVKTPHILMLSGIGDAAHLSSMGIKPLVDLPAVGQNLQDHPYLRLAWFVNSTNTLDNIARNATLAAQVLAQWQANGTGPLSLGGGTQRGFLRINDSDSFFASLGTSDPSAGPTSAHYEFITRNGFGATRLSLPAEGHFFSLTIAVISPTARGNITLASPNPFDAPLINPNLLGTPTDLAIMRSAIRAARAFVAAPAWAGYILDEFGPSANAHTNAELDAYSRENADTIDHPVGSVAMGKGEKGALEPDLRVKGTVGLRVVDASAFPFIISGHTQGPTYILAERAAALVRDSLDKA